jgi:GT2 family glycosyltransferase
VIVVNDGSPDTAALEAALIPYRHRIHYIAQENRGAGAARNAGIAVARGRYVAFLDADDRWMPPFLAHQVAFLEAYGDIDLVYTDAVVSGASVPAGRLFSTTAPSCPDVTLENLIAQRCNVILSTVMMRRAPLLAAGGFDETLRRGQDFDLWLRLAHSGVRLAYQPLVLAERRVRATGLSGDSVTKIRRALHVLERFAAATNLPHAVRACLQSRVATLSDRLAVEQAKLDVVQGNFAAARQHLRKPAARPLKVRIALLGLRVAPRLFRLVYVRARQPLPIGR